MARARPRSSRRCSGSAHPVDGSVRLHGLDPVRDHVEVVARTGALLQRGGVWAPMSPRDVLRLTASYYRAPRDVNELMSATGSRAMRDDAVAAPQWR